VTPLLYLTKRCRPNCGSTSTNRWTWSGRISRAMTSARYLAAVLCINPSNRFSTPPARKLCGGTWGTKQRDICHCKRHCYLTCILASFGVYIFAFCSIVS
jgi:hypothetical protein